jgi:Cytochrome C oxidase, cbb3-type, subunit III
MGFTLRRTMRTRRRLTGAIALALMGSVFAMVGPGLAAGSHTSKDRKRCAHELPQELKQLSHPQSLSSSPPAALTSILEVLRRPATSSDQLPAHLGPAVGYTGVWVDYVRMLGITPDGTKYFLIPGVNDLQLPSACLSELPKSKLLRNPAQPTGTVKIQAYSDTGDLGSAAHTPSEIAAGNAFFILPNGPSKGEISGLVPDGVASVTLSSPQSTPETVPVANNLFLAPVNATGPRIISEGIGQEPNQEPSSVVEWHSADGTVTKTIRIPNSWVTAALEIDRSVAQSIPVPPAVQRAGGKQVGEFLRGNAVVAQSGCLACHRLGDAGNKGPGPPLTHIGSTLTETQIEHALISPRAPMPSFKNLPGAKLKAVVEFLSLLH